MTNDVDSEIEAIRVVLNALQPLNAAARETVLDYVLKRLEMKGSGPVQTPPKQHTSTPAVPATPIQPAESAHLHIKEFKKQKEPRSAIEMAAIVAYYLANMAPETDRKTSVGTSDLDTYFKIAEFKLPAQQKFTLINARNAGYFDSLGGGEYKLNAVGHNLVVHSMPRKGNDSDTTRKGSAKKKQTKKKNATKTIK